MTDEKTAAPAGKIENGAPRYRSPVFVVPAAIALAVLLYFGVAYMADIFTHESTDDAFIAGHVVSIAPRIAGQVTGVYVKDNQLVRSNDLLVEIDPADYAITVGQKQAASVSQGANFRTIVAAYELMRTKVATAEATARKSQADADAAEATAKRAAADFERAQNLLKQNTVSKQEFDSAQEAKLKAESDFKSAQEAVEEDTSKVEEAEKQAEAAFAEKDMAFAQLSESQTNVAAAELNFSYTKIYAPCDGRVTRKAVEVGDYLQTAQQIMSLVPTNVWVVANFKESQLKGMQTNQPVMVSIDAIGGREFKAHVDSVQAGSGAQFSLLPPENATGNYVKVVQRVPVKIVFDEPLPADHVVGPGLSVTPSVEISQYILPTWTRALIATVIAFAATFIFMAVTGRKSNGK